jgi:hypothetical protein
MSKDAPQGGAQPSATAPWDATRAPAAMPATGNATMPGTVEGNVGAASGTPVMPAGMPATGGNMIAPAPQTRPPMTGGLPTDPRYATPQPAAQPGNAMMPGTVEGNVGAPLPPTGGGMIAPAPQTRAPIGGGLPAAQPASPPSNAMSPGTVEANVGAASRTPVMAPQARPTGPIGSTGPYGGLPAPQAPAPRGALPPTNTFPAAAPMQGGGIMAPQSFGLMQPSVAQAPYISQRPTGMPPVPPGSMAPQGTGGGMLPPAPQMRPQQGMTPQQAMAQRPAMPRSFSHWQQPNRAYTR